MNDQIYPLDRDALLRAVNKRNWDSRTLSKMAGVYLGTVRRLLGEEYPKDMKPDRREKITGRVAKRLANALRVKPQDIAPDLPERPPEKRPPEPPPDPPKSQLAAWRSRRQLADIHERRWRLAAEALEQENV